MLGGGQFLMPVLTYGFNAGALLTQGGWVSFSCLLAGHFLMLVHTMTETDGSGPSLNSSFAYFFHPSELMPALDPTNNPTGYIYDAAWRLQKGTTPTQAIPTADFDNDGLS